MAGKSFALSETTQLKGTDCYIWEAKLEKMILVTWLGTKKALLGSASPWEDGAVWQVLSGGSSPSLISLANQSPQHLPLRCKKAHDSVFKSLL